MMVNLSFSESCLTGLLKILQKECEELKQILIET